MSTVDVKSLFKSGKKTIKAFKVAGAPAADTAAAKSAEDTLEHWDAPVADLAAPAAVGVSMGVDDFKGETQEAGGKPTVTWKEAAAPVEEAKPKSPVAAASAYVPPSQRRAEATKAMPSLEEVARLSSAQQSTKTVAATSAAPVLGGPTRLKLITSASKKALEDEAKKKEEEKAKKELEKQARKEQLRAEFERAASAGPLESASSQQSEPVSTHKTVQAGSLSEIYAKYVDRPKRGRKMVESH